MTPRTAGYFLGRAERHGAPAHGTATVDTSTGQVTYTPAVGYVGADTLVYEIRDGTRLETGEDLTLYSTTVGLTILPMPDHVAGSHLRIRPELRYDHANAPEFDGGTSNDQFTVALDVLVTF